MENNSFKNSSNKKKLNKINNSEENNTAFYTKIYDGYRKNTQKEKTFQIILFIIELIVIVILIINLIFSLIRFYNHPSLNFGPIFFCIPSIPLVLLGFYQFRIINNWNRAVNLPNSSIVKSHYNLINQLNKLMIIAALILGIASSIIITQFIIPSILFIPPPFKLNLNFFIEFLRTLSIVMLAAYIILESVYIRRWLKKMRALNKIEQLIIDENSEFFELTNEYSFQKKK